jgi:hypothetical protein
MMTITPHRYRETSPVTRHHRPHQFESACVTSRNYGLLKRIPAYVAVSLHWQAVMSILGEAVSTFLTLVWG